MDVTEYVAQLPWKQQIELAILLCNKALPIWTEYARKNKMTYTETVVGTSQKIDRRLLERGLEAVEAEKHLSGIPGAADEKKQVKAMLKEFQEPIVALQDDDWDLPYNVECLLYAVNNLLRALNGQKREAFQRDSLGISVNQSFDAMLKEGMIRTNQIWDLVLPFGAHDLD